MAQRVEEPAKPLSPATACPALSPRHPVGLPFAPSLPACRASLLAGRPSASLFEEMGLKSLIGHQPTLPPRPSLFPTQQRRVAPSVSGLEVLGSSTQRGTKFFGCQGEWMP